MSVLQRLLYWIGLRSDAGPRKYEVAAPLQVSLKTLAEHEGRPEDVELSLRDRVLEQCCQYVKRLSFSNSVVVLVPHLCTDEYQRFFPLLAAVANEIIPLQDPPEEKALPGILFY